MIDYLKNNEFTVSTDYSSNIYKISNSCIELVFCVRECGIYLTSLKEKSNDEHEWIACDSSPIFKIPKSLRTQSFDTVEIGYEEANENGRSVLLHKITIKSIDLKINLQTIIYPNLPVIKQWITFENLSNENIPVDELTILDLNLYECNKQYYVIGDNNTPYALMIKENQIIGDYNHQIHSDKHVQHLPWSCFTNQSPRKDSLAIWLDYVASWGMRAYTNGKNLSFNSYIQFNDTISPHEKWDGPSIVFCAFAGDFDNMMEIMYKWQYIFQWDYVNNNYFARPAYAAPWYFHVPNLSENFASRIGYLDITTIDYADAVGAELLWHDAGWSEGVDIWKPTQEGPDFSHTIKYLKKKGMGFIIWFAGHPQSWLLQNKVNSWGDFQWRTDAQGEITERLQRDMHVRMETFLKDNPNCSFHTCDGGGKYSHCFSVQRLSDTNYLADMGNGEHTNYFTSYWEVPDKWLDGSSAWLGKGYCNPLTMRTNLSMCPTWAFYASPETLIHVRQMMRIYKYLLTEGVAGRWSFTYHPEVEHDDNTNYCQRTSFDKKKSCIILKKIAKSFSFKVFPKGLILDFVYSITLDSRTHGAKYYANWLDNEPMLESRTGKDLMENGILLSIQSLFPGDLIYLGMENRPGSGNDKIPPIAPGKVFTKCEVNCGHLGVGIYWSPGYDENFLDGYEIMRNDKQLAVVHTGKFYFDRTMPYDCNAKYFVRSVDGDGNVSEWVMNEKLHNESVSYSALGNHGENMKDGGWLAEYSNDEGKTYQLMKWISPAYSTAGDLGGRGDQPGGVEGLWNAPNGAVIGRGWQVSSNTEQAARTFIAPEDGRVAVNGRVMMEKYHADKGGSLIPAIYHNDKLVWGKNEALKLYLNDLNGHSHMLVLNLKRHDCIRFVMDCGTSAEDDIVGWMPSITYINDESAGNVASTVRILCGSNRRYIDKQGNHWLEDSFYQGGIPIVYNYTGASIPFFEILNGKSLSCRLGETISYSIPVSKGIYSVRLIFAEPKYKYSFERPFNIDIGGERVDTNFDINQFVHCRNNITEKKYEYIIPQKDGKIHISLSGGFDPMQKSWDAIISGIEILPQTEKIIRVHAGNRNFIDWNGDVWSALELPPDAELLTSDMVIAQASPTLYDQALYQSAFESARLIFDFELPQGSYTVHLKFCELWQQDHERKLSITINHERINSEYAIILPENSKGRASDFRFSGVIPNCDGKINITIESTDKLPAIVQAIEIF